MALSFYGIINTEVILLDITSVNNPLVKDAVKLQQKKYRDMFNLFVVEGYHLYEEASKFDIIKHISVYI